MATDPTPAKTDFGAIGLLLAMFMWVLFLVATFGGKLYKPDTIQRVSNFIFDFGFVISVCSLVFAFIGLFKRGRSRLQGAVAIVLLISPVMVGIAWQILHR